MIDRSPLGETWHASGEPECGVTTFAEDKASSKVGSLGVPVTMDRALSKRLERNMN